MANAIGMKYLSQVQQKPLTFLFCPSSAWPIPRTTWMLFNNELLWDITSIMAIAFISLALSLWHYNVQQSGGIWSFTTGLIFLWRRVQYLFSRSSWTSHPLLSFVPLSQGRCHIFREPCRSCFLICNKLNATVFEFREASLWQKTENKIWESCFQIRIEKLTEPTTLLVENLLPLEGSSYKFQITYPV